LTGIWKGETRKGDSLIEKKQTPDKFTNMKLSRYSRANRERKWEILLMISYSHKMGILELIGFARPNKIRRGKRNPPRLEVLPIEGTEGDA